MAASRKVSATTKSNDSHQRKNTKTGQMNQRRHNFKKSNNKERFKHTRGNIEEGQGFADYRKRKILNEYRKILRKEKCMPQEDKSLSKTKEVIDTDNVTNTQHIRSKKKMKFNALNRAKLEFERQKKEKEKQKEEAMKRKAEQGKALDEYKDRRKKKHKAIAKRNFKGQPNMASQMDYLLSKIQGNG